jgi:hypothetical protein
VGELRRGHPGLVVGHDSGDRLGIEALSKLVAEPLRGGLGGFWDWSRLAQPGDETIDANSGVTSSATPKTWS